MKKFVFLSAFAFIALTQGAVLYALDDYNSYSNQEIQEAAQKKQEEIACLECALSCCQKMQDLEEKKARGTDNYWGQEALTSKANCEQLTKKLQAAQMNLSRIRCIIQSRGLFEVAG